MRAYMRVLGEVGAEGEIPLGQRDSGAEEKGDGSDKEEHDGRRQEGCSVVRWGRSSQCRYLDVDLQVEGRTN